MLSDGVVPQPEDLETGTTLKVTDFKQIRNVIFTQIKLPEIFTLREIAETLNLVEGE